MATAVYAHELGHLLGLPDIYDDKAFLKGLPADIYVGPWCLMSLVRGFFHFSAFHKLRLGWLKPERVQTVSPEENALVRLKPLESAVQEGFQALKIPLGDRLYYLVEVRRLIGFDRDLPDEGMVVTLVNEKIPECMHHGDCYLRVVNAEPDKPDLRHATFDLRPGKKNVFVSPDRDLVIALVARDGDESVVRVATREQWQATLESENKAAGR